MDKISNQPADEAEEALCGNVFLDKGLRFLKLPAKKTLQED